MGRSTLNHVTLARCHIFSVGTFSIFMRMHVINAPLDIHCVFTTSMFQDMFKRRK